MNKTIHIKNFKIENKQDIQNFFKQSNIFSQHNLVTGNGLSTYDLYGKLFEQFEVFDKLTKAINNIINIPFLDMWANINPPGTNVRPHNHFSEKYPNTLVGVYYLNKPVNSGNLIIEGNEIQINEDDLIFFNDVDMHWSQENKSMQDRVAISFNLN